MPLLPKKFPTPVAGPVGPFFAAGMHPLSSLIVLYGVNSFANVLMNTEEFKNDPRNPNAKAQKH
ncbi:putative mitochondrial F1F0 ATP synthase subunit Atp18 [Aspergillus heteromorphus CBS 117.55]|uniref:Putative mitochondrial F1F0 ATP synthase subunit Atp18 n=1 Tax=Aspergillus heteromorphus CBS 117.55 TaxID=1448321 RepID=A0A317X375_9EURO|nr:putative mitochondrial F1F0 ATP synthase subunit Atp18 [Aspergillus heteromorphus CBS 117.55]PWY91010.1 putative mitochondrial F1F0 ATP synthase subunit Atp18 [Aspergillus heteromorphus CBS 117.55]